jgi:putative ATP-binding cassette transporter
MNTATLRPTVDWSNELVPSILWILQMFAITAPSVLVVLIVIGRTTEWGRQFWRITGDYF